MTNAVKLATQARGQTAPNPMVGAVVVNQQGEIIGRGFHPRAGEPHAEVFAIREAKAKTQDLSQCTLFVTLEPCNHWGRTPPCTDLILESKIKKIVVGVLDPNPLMNGKSVELLKNKGLIVEIEVAQKSDCEKLIRGYQTVSEKGRPFVTVKAATSLDGKIATSSGESKWLTNESSRALAHEERAQHDAILVGVGTVLADDPQLTARHDSKNEKLKKVILDSRLLTPPTARLFDSHSQVLIYCDPSYAGERRKLLEAVGATVIPVAADESFSEPGFLNIKSVFADLAARGVQELLVEGGARVLGAIVREQLFDRMVYFLAPKILGSASRDVFEGLDISNLDQCVNLENISAKLIGKDIVIEGSRVHRPH
jgi:diaminohydroxyphosphoribosylaminopyrimidine deaminase/5-amino-6-(5-phosphoribosylamino)uracil reductase